MMVNDPGHQYILQQLDPPGEDVLQFVKRVGEKYPGNEEPCPGTIMQEVLRACIHRCLYVRLQRKSFYTSVALWLMCICVWLLEARAAKEHGRPKPNFHDSVYGATCYGCGHVGCKGECGRI